MKIGLVLFMKKIFFLFLALQLAACASAEERKQKLAQKEVNICIQRGLAPETPEFDKCRAEIRAAEQKRREERMQGTDDLHSPSSWRVQRW